MLSGIWKAASLIVGSALILPSPESVISDLAVLVSSPRFAQAFLATGLRGLAAFAISLALGLSAGIPAGLWPAFRSALRPLLAVIRSTPVLALILILLIWVPQDSVPVVSAVLMAFPVFLASVSEGVRAADPRLVEMARVFHMRRRERISGIYFPALLPFLVSGASACLGLIWKVVVAGEVLSLPARAIGTGLHEAKIYLDTSRAMAWALSAVILCALTDAAFALVSRCLRRSAGQVSRSGGLMGSARDGASHAD